MTAPRADSGDGFLTEPDAILAWIIADLEPSLDRDTIAAAITRAAPTRSGQRRTASALTQDPTLLTSGRPYGPPQVARLIRALLLLGATRPTPPRCGHCGLPKHLPHRDQKLRICAGCYQRRRATDQPRTACEATKHAGLCDQQGRPGNRQDPLGQILAHVTALEHGLGRDVLTDTIRRALPHSFQHRRLATELDAHPGLLAGQGAHGSTRVNTLIDALIDAGARAIVAPACPRCGRTVRLTHQIDGLRCCRRCYDAHHAVACSRCRHRRPVAARTTGGAPVCGSCFTADAANHELCTSCGRTGPIIHRDHDQVLCHRCWTGPVATCYLCGQDRPCHFAATDRPRCRRCSSQLYPACCSRCGRTRRVCARTAAGDPLCESCSRRREPCTSCGRRRRVEARLSAGPLCRGCYRIHPASHQPCSQCEAVEHLHHHGLCAGCACRNQLLSLLAHPDGDLRPHAEAIYHALHDSDPAAMLAWIAAPATRQILADISDAETPPTHQLLDDYRPSRAREHLRRVLTARGILPHRDEHLARLERSIPAILGRVYDRDERRIVRSFASWYHLRRLRRKSERADLTADQADRARAGINNAVNLIAWLHNQGHSLASCTQRDVDRWVTESAHTRRQTRAFLTWTSEHGHTNHLQIPLPARSDKVTRLDQHEQWGTVRRLLHDDTVATRDRFAGLLLLLYGQPASKIARLRRDQIQQSPNRTQLLLGDRPLDLPNPLGNLARDLTHTRRGHATVGHTDEHPWLFPGGAPGQPISASQLRTRLQTLGVHPRAARNSALIDLAAQLPPAVLAHLLGIHIITAGTWAERAGGTRASYAAELARR